MKKTERQSLIMMRAVSSGRDYILMLDGPIEFDQSCGANSVMRLRIASNSIWSL
jgi:hypothetical protein